MKAQPISEIMQEWKELLLEVAQESTEVVSTDVVDDTPVLSGDLAASWNPENGPAVAKNRSGDDMPDISAVTTTLDYGDLFSMTNGRDYAHRIEYEGGSQKAPSGMMEINLARWQFIVDEVVRSK